jgi:glycosyltransferase involved in cell wall biosynthesis
MKVSVLTPDLSHNCLGRAYLLAKILQRHYQAEIIGPVLDNGIWTPLAQLDGLDYTGVEVRSLPHFLFQLRVMLKEITGDVVYASKPLLTSLGIGLLKKLLGRRPLVLDIDDWEMGFVKYNYRSMRLADRLKHVAYSTLQPYGLGSYWNNSFGEKLTRFASEITVSNSFLKNKFGGTIVWHARDTGTLNPEGFDKSSLRGTYDMDRNKRLVMFLGTPGPYKGIEDLIEATSLIQDQDVVFALVGVDERSYSRNLTRLGEETLGGRFRVFGPQPFGKIPEFLAMSDVIVIPQRRNLATVGQLPAKVFDAMAMAKPIVATAISDLPEILDGCGWTVEPGSPKQLAETIQYVIDHSGQAEQMGRKARQKCIQKYSWDAMEKVLVNIFSKYE